MFRDKTADLVRRVHSQWSRPRGFQELSLRLTCDDRTCFFPLDVPDEARAARRADAIRRVVLTQGWDAGVGRFAREFTFALAWGENPMVFTYSTLYTRPVRQARSPLSAVGRSARSRRASVALVEGDWRLGRALSDWVGRLAEYRGAVLFGSAGEIQTCGKGQFPYQTARYL